MAPQVNRYERLVFARLLDFFSSKTHWNRGLWNGGTILALQEVLEASEAQRDGHLNEKTIRGAISTAIRSLGSDPGFGTFQERETTFALLSSNGEPRDELLYGGLEYEGVAEAIRTSTPGYLRNCANAVVVGRQLPLPERTARAIASHMLDLGFHSDFLHRWWTRQIRSQSEQGQPTLSQMLEDAAALVNSAETTFTVLVAFPSPLLPP
ncbi:MAG TPA: hypothetical protein VFT65_14540, partial [Candidatus Angelobacter sp.]|nr:hypothetical protein [Candidatus Angelobacter sp.]